MPRLNLNKKEKKVNYNQIISRRFIAFLVVVLLLFGIVGVKLYTVMVVDHDKYT